MVEPPVVPAFLERLVSVVCPGLLACLADPAPPEQLASPVVLAVLDLLVSQVISPPALVAVSSQNLL